MWLNSLIFKVKLVKFYAPLHFALESLIVNVKS